MSEAHRSHLYKYLANEKRYPHVLVSLLFASVQLVLNLVLLEENWGVTWLFFAVITAIYLGYRINQEGWNRLVKKY